MAMRHDDFLSRGARLYGLSADPPPQNAAVMQKLALTFPILSDIDRQAAITPLGFADEKDPRQISRAGVVIVDGNGEIVHRSVGRDYADRPEEDELIGVLRDLDLSPTSQARPDVGEIQQGERAIPLEGIPHYLRGAKFAALALRGRYRDMSDEFKDDAKAYVQMVDRYLEAMAAAIDRKG